MTAALLVGVYLVALSFFLGLDIVGKVPPTLYAIVLAGLGALCGVTVVGGLHLAARATGTPSTLGLAAAGLAGAAVVGGLFTVGRLAQTFVRKSRS